MRSIFNFIIAALLLGGLYAAATNPTIRSYFNASLGETKSEIAHLAGGTPVSFNPKSILSNFDKLVSLGTNLTGTGEISPVVTPGPLTKIPVSNPSNQPVPLSTEQPSAPVQQNLWLLTRSGIIVQTNTQRVGQGQAQLVESFQLDASAQKKAEDILARQYFEHVAPDGRDVSDLVADQNYAYLKIGENLALGTFSSDADVVTAWMQSPGHRANMLDSQFTEIGVGVAHGTYQGRTVYVAVQHFGRPRSLCPSVDASLKTRVEAGQAELAQEAAELEKEKAAIDQGRAAGMDENAAIALYNAGVERYQSQLIQIDGLRVAYNTQVAAFNQCAQPAE